MYLEILIIVCLIKKVKNADNNAAPIIIKINSNNNSLASFLTISPLRKLCTAEIDLFTYVGNTN